MHNCRETKDQVTELLLNGADSLSDEVLSTELRACADCREEFDALKATLRLTARLRETAAPAESYWPGYHTRLRQKLSHAHTTIPASQPSGSSSLLQLFKSSVRVPVPVGVALIIACGILVMAAVRPARQQVAQSPSVVHVPVDVPVIQEKIVTRVVYRERRLPSRISKQRLHDANVNDAFARSQKLRADDLPASLVGFRPTDEIKLTVIKGGSSNEK